MIPAISVREAFRCIFSLQIPQLLLLCLCHSSSLSGCRVVRTTVVWPRAKCLTKSIADIQLPCEVNFECWKGNQSKPKYVTNSPFRVKVELESAYTLCHFLTESEKVRFIFGHFALLTGEREVGGGRHADRPEQILPCSNSYFQHGNAPCCKTKVISSLLHGHDNECSVLPGHQIWIQ